MTLVFSTGLYKAQNNPWIGGWPVILQHGPLGVFLGEAVVNPSGSVAGSVFRSGLTSLQHSAHDGGSLAVRVPFLLGACYVPGLL